MLNFFVLLIFCLVNEAHGLISPANSTYTRPQNPATLYGSNTDRVITVIARDANGAPTTGGDIVIAELFSSSPSCDNNSTYPNCIVTCAPKKSPNIPSPSCLSIPSRASPSPPTSYPSWIVASVQDQHNGNYTVTYSGEYVGVYDLSVYTLTVGGLSGKYYDNIWFLNNPVSTRIDSTVNFHWGTGPLVSFSVDYVGIRWTGKIRPSFSEDYNIFVYGDDWIRVYVDKVLIISAWGGICCNETWATVTLQAGHYHDIIVEYVELTSSASVELRWSSPSTPKQIIPSSSLYYMSRINSIYPSLQLNAGDPPVSTYSSIYDTKSNNFLNSSIAGLNSTLNIQAVDVFNNTQTIQSSSAVWSFTIVGPDPSPYTNFVYSGTGGIWLGTYNVRIAGAYTLTLKLGGVSVGKISSYTINVIPSSTLASSSIAYGNGLLTGVSGITSYFQIQARDKYNNNRTTGDDDVYISLIPVITSLGGSSTGSVIYSSSGIYNAFYTPTIAGTYLLSVYLSLQHIQSSPFTVSISSGPVYYPSITANGTSLSSSTAAVQTSFSIQARDKFKNTVAISTLNFNVVFSSTSSSTTFSPDSIQSSSTGLYTVYYTPVLAGTYSISVSLLSSTNIIGGPISLSPFSLTVKAGVLSPSRSIATGSTLSSTTAGVVSYFIIKTRDVNDNFLTASTASATATCTLTCPSASPITGVCVPLPDATYNCSYTPTLASSSCSLSVMINSISIFASPFTVSVSPSSPSSSTTRVIGSSLLLGTAGQINTFQIQAVDAYNNDISTGGHKFNVYITHISSKSNVSSSIIDLNNGRYNVSYTCIFSGNYSISITLSSLGGLYASYYTDQLRTQLYQRQIDKEINFNWGYDVPLNNFPTSDYFGISWDGLLTVPTSDIYQIYVNIAAGSGVLLYINNNIIINAWDPSYGTTELVTSISFNSNTYYNISLIYNELYGLAQVSLLWSSTKIKKSIINSTYLYHVDTVTTYTTQISPSLSSSTTSYFTSPPTNASSAYTYKVYVYLRDIYNNNQTTNNEAAFITANSECQGVVDNGVVVSSSLSSGVYEVSITPTKSGISTLSVYYKSSALLLSPYKYTVSPGILSSSTSTIYGSSLTSSTAGVLSTFYIQSKDINNNLILTDTHLSLGGFNVVFVHTSLPSTTISTSIVYDKNGIYNVTYTPIYSGTYNVVTKLGSATLTAYTCVIMSALSSPSQTYILNTPSTSPLNISLNSNTIWYITVRDVYTNIITNTSNAFVVRIYNSSSSSTTPLYKPIFTMINAGNYSISLLSPSSSCVSCQLSISLPPSTKQGLTGYYYNNRWFDGVHILSKIDDNINFQYNGGLITPTASLYVSVRWIGYISSLNNKNGNHSIIVNVASNARIYIDNILLIDSWNSNSGIYTSSIYLLSNILYDIKIEYRQNTDVNSGIQLYWLCQECGQTTQSIIPTQNLYPSATPILNSPYSISIQ